MDLPSAFNAPRLVYLQESPYWIRGITLEGLATVLAWLDDILPPDPERKGFPRLGDAASQAAVFGPGGQALLAWLALKPLGFGYEEASELACGASPTEQSRLFDVLFKRRPSLKRGSGDGEDLGESWWGPNLCALAERYHIGLEEMARMTLDQYDCLASGGLEYEDPRALTPEQVQAMIDASQKAYEESQKNGAAS